MARTINSREAWRLMSHWAANRLLAQVPAVLIISLFLLVFQVLVLGVPLEDAAMLAGGLLACILGLTLFLEGLTTGLMPLGEATGLSLPQRSPLVGILIFAFLLGALATFAEPAIGILRNAGRDVDPVATPLLHYVLQLHPEYLVLAIASGVGLAVLVGTLRFQRSWRLKPLVLILSLLALALSAICSCIPMTTPLVALAWDSGGITTGPVTVPLVLALGMGISRSLGKSDDTFAGFGIVALASLLPVITVLALALIFAPLVANLPTASTTTAVLTAANNWQTQLPGIAWSTLQAVIPLSLFLILVLVLILRERLKRPDELLFGIVACLAGFFLLNAGIEFGLSRLGNQVGQAIPASFTAVERPGAAVDIQPFLPSMINHAIDKDGLPHEFFYLQTETGPRAVPFDRNAWNQQDNSYHHVPVTGPLFDRSSPWGYLLVLLFAFLTGYGATRAEPALMTMGATVEELTVGIMKRSTLIQSVAIGVGLGLAAGIACLLWSIPVIWLLAPTYCACLVLNLLADESTVNIAWDSGGVTTGPVTVPLVLALGLGIAGELGLNNGFGLLACASAFPILVVLLTGIVSQRRRNAT